MTNLVDEDVIVPTNTHLNPECNILKFSIKDNYKFIKNGILFRIFSFLTYILAIIVFLPITKIAYGLKINGRKNLKLVKNAIFVSNHICTLDFISIFTHVTIKHRPYIIANHRPFHMPIVRHLVKLLRAIPLPETPTSTKRFIKEVNNSLSKGSSLLIFPEGAMWNYYHKIRPFMSGAFRFSIKNNVDIVPLVLTYRKPNLFYRIFGRKKPLITINILPPIQPNIQAGTEKEQEQYLREFTYQTMSKFFQEHSTYKEYTSKQVNKILKNKKSQE